MVCGVVLFFFFFQAEDGIRDWSVTGVQTCALPISVVEAGITRLRPILMTSISTVAGMVPIALELGAGGEVRSPMAIAVIGGFLTATLLTLVVVPVFFTYISSARSKTARVLSRATGIRQANIRKGKASAL